MKTKTPLDEAIELLGGATKTAKAVGLGSRQAVHMWRKQGLPIKHAIRLEKLTSGAVTAEQLRPDVFK